MKRKSCFTLALILIMVQLVSVFAFLPVGAEAYGRSYTVKKSAVAPEVDGKADQLWNLYAFSDTFKLSRTAGSHSNNTLNAKMKMLFVENAADSSKMDVYLMVQVSGYTKTRTDINGFHLFFRDASGKSNSNVTRFTGASSQQGFGVTYAHYKHGNYDAKAQIAADVCTFEFRYTINKTEQIKFDIYVIDAPSWSAQVDYSWNGNNGSLQEPEGILTFEDDANINTVSPKSYTVYQSVFAPAVDGIAETLWEDHAWSDDFGWVWSNGTYSNPNLKTKMKLMYVENAADANKLDVYLMIQSTGYGAHTGVDGFHIYITDASGSSKTDVLRYNGSQTGSNLTYTWYKHGTYDAAAKTANNVCTFEFHFQLNKAAAANLDIAVLDGTGWSANQSMNYSWSGCANGLSDRQKAYGTLNFVDETKEVITIETREGASIRVDTANPNQSGIRFATTVDAARLSALVADGATVTTGTLILSTASLANAGIAAADFTEAALKTAGMIEGTHYYNLVNENNEWFSENGVELTGTWCGTLYNIRDFQRAFSAIGYVTVTYHGVTTTLYGGYNDHCSRTIAFVAGQALEDEAIEWTTEQKAILTSFCQG